MAIANEDKWRLIQLLGNRNDLDKLDQLCSFMWGFSRRTSLQLLRAHNFRKAAFHYAPMRKLSEGFLLKSWIPRRHQIGRRPNISMIGTQSELEFESDRFRRKLYQQAQVWLPFCPNNYLGTLTADSESLPNGEDSSLRRIGGLFERELLLHEHHSLMITRYIDVSFWRSRHERFQQHFGSFFLLYGLVILLWFSAEELMFKFLS